MLEGRKPPGSDEMGSVVICMHIELTHKLDLQT